MASTDCTADWICLSRRIGRATGIENRASAGVWPLAEVLANPRASWTPTAKANANAKAVVGIALALRDAHGLGLLHGAVKAANAIFDAHRRIPIADFSAMRLESGEWEPFWFRLFEIAVGRPAILPPYRCSGGVSRPSGVPDFVSRMIEEARSPESQW
jgi:serine/threonine protein kinase